MIGYLKIFIFIIFAIALLSRTTYGKPLRNNKGSYHDKNEPIGIRGAEAPEEPNQDEGILQQVFNFNIASISS